MTEAVKENATKEELRDFARGCRVPRQKDLTDEQREQFVEANRAIDDRLRNIRLQAELARRDKAWSVSKVDVLKDARQHRLAANLAAMRRLSRLDKEQLDVQAHKAIDEQWAKLQPSLVKNELARLEKDRRFIVVLTAMVNGWIGRPGVNLEDLLAEGLSGDLSLREFCLLLGQLPFHAGFDRNRPGDGVEGSAGPDVKGCVCTD